MQNQARQQRSMLPLGFLNFFIYGIMVIFGGFFQLYLQDIGLDKLEIGSLIAMAPVVSIAAHPFWKYCNERQQNAKYVLVMTLTGLLVASLLVYQATTYTNLYWIMIVFYFFQTTLPAQNNTLTLHYIEPSRYKFETLRQWGSIGTGVIAIISGVIFYVYDQIDLIFVLIACLLLAIGSAFILRPVPYGNEVLRLTSKEIRGSLQSKHFIVFVILGMLIAISSTMNAIFMPIFLTELGGSRLDVGLAIALSVVAETAVYLALRRYIRKDLTSLMICIAITALLFSIRWYLMSQTTSPAQVLLLQCMHAITLGGFYYVGTQITTLLLPRPFRSSGQAVLTLGWGGVSGVIAGLLGGWLYQTFGGVTMYKAGFTFAFIGMLGFAFMGYRMFKRGYTPIIHNPEYDSE
ncbi:PPP family 3-phenylpropionic acid transporter [Paenibacillus shirakamiensis]|uniref:PPP family 3-phenylpropionic acid transporter n=1 Tax=Paenibacillus shirakamiensis TaxID=1265935 RepID=A0ABS4JJH1_9BACL|nr:MFS transporter [Paenibacillus shirakamiensis]MBP2001855.1 PPP family 3-phenylpropionic acid transporter [Paenibacillus shirakamiensis]